MNTIATNNKQTSLIKFAAWSAFFDIVIVISQTVLLIKRQITFSAEAYLSHPIPVPILIPLIPLLFSLVALILYIKQTRNKEAEDELSTQHRHTANHIALCVCTIMLVVSIGIIKDFHFAFSGDLLDDITLPLIILFVIQFVENIVFIILEKR